MHTWIQLSPCAHAEQPPDSGSPGTPTEPSPGGGSPEAPAQAEPEGAPAPSAATPRGPLPIVGGNPGSADASPEPPSSTTTGNDADVQPDEQTADREGDLSVAADEAFASPAVADVGHAVAAAVAAACAACVVAW